MACEMESSAIQLYTRALSLMEQLGRQDEPLYDHLTLMRADEQEHLAQFRALGGRDDLAQERRVALSAAADNILFEGGRMGAARALAVWPGRRNSRSRSEKGARTPRP